MLFVARVQRGRFLIVLGGGSISSLYYRAATLAPGSVVSEPICAVRGNEGVLGWAWRVESGEQAFWLPDSDADCLRSPT